MFFNSFDPHVGRSTLAYLYKGSFDLDTIYKIKIHIKYLLPQVWNKIIADNQHNLEKFRKSQNSFTWRTMEVVVFFTHFFAMNTSFIRMLF